MFFRGGEGGFLLTALENHLYFVSQQFAKIYVSDWHWNAGDIRLGQIGRLFVFFSCLIFWQHSSISHTPSAHSHSHIPQLDARGKPIVHKTLRTYNIIIPHLPITFDSHGNNVSIETELVVNVDLISIACYEWSVAVPHVRNDRSWNQSAEREVIRPAQFKPCVLRLLFPA